MSNTTQRNEGLVAPDGMIWLEGDTFQMGSDNHYPEEAPKHRVRVSGFWMDRELVTNRDFARFVEATGYITSAEIAPNAADYPGALPHLCRPGSMVFSPPALPVRPVDWRDWWEFRIGTSWKCPEGPETSIGDILDHPVVHVSCDDALAYAKWVGKSLPTEAEWEYAAWGGQEGTEFAWGDELHPDGRPMANTWQGQFPWQNECVDGYARTSPVGQFPANGYGLFDMVGNVWEWTKDWFSQRHSLPTKACCIPENPRGGTRERSGDDGSGARIPRKVVKGGSYLCAPNYCRRYRPAARHPHPVDTSTSHIGFRCVKRVK